jgi:predicted O-methyltransferase YrrM
LDKIAEKYFLKDKLHPKINFYKESARYFINKKIASNEKYDFVFIDAYS